MVITEPRHHRVEVLGLGLRVYEWPVVAARGTVLLHHGFLDHGRSWDPVATALCAAGWRVLALDARGHGSSEWVGAGGYYHFQDYVLDLDTVLRTLAADVRVALVGHSLGGMVCGYYAGAFPERVLAYVALEGLGPPELAWDDAPPRMAEWIAAVHNPRVRTPRRLADLEAAVARLRAYNPRLSPEFARHLAVHGTRPHPEGGLVWAYDPLHRTRSPQIFRRELAAAFWRRITAPVLYVDGAESGFDWVLDDGRPAELGARHVRLAGAGHMLHHDRPVELSAVLIEFFDAIT